jgi:hypothetical protein
MSDPTSRPASHPTRQQLDDLDALMQRMLALPVNQEGEQAGPSTVALPDLSAVAVEPPPIALAPPPELSEPKLPEPPKPAPPSLSEPRVETPPVNYRHPEPPQPSPVHVPEPHVERPSVEYRPEHPVIDYRRVEAPAVDYRRVEVAPLVPPRVEMPKPEYRVPDVPEMRIPDVTLAPGTPPNLPSPTPPVEKPAALNGNGAEPHVASPPKLNGKANLLEPVRINVRLETPRRRAPLIRHKPPRAFRRPVVTLMLAPLIWMNLSFDRWVGRFGRLGRSFRTPGGRMLLGWLGLAFLSGAVAWAVINGMGWTR